MREQSRNCALTQLQPGPRWRTALAAGTAMLLTCLVGCGIFFSKKDKPMTVEVVFIGGDSLNFDGRAVHSVRVKAFVLRTCERFGSADAPAIFNPDADPVFTKDFADDTLAEKSVFVAPKKTERTTLVVPAIRTRDIKPQFAAIADFAQQPERGRERVCLKIGMSSQQRICIKLGKNWLELAKKCQ